MRFQRIHPSWPYRLKKGLRAGLVATGTAIGVVGGIIGGAAALGKPIPLWIIVGAAIFCVLVGVITVILKAKSTHIPDEIIYDYGDGDYQIEYCTPDSLREANRLTKPYYGREYVRNEVAEMWRQKNPRGFVHINNTKGELCACFGILALEDSFMKQFIKGKLVDNDLSSEDILGPEESKDAKELYISGVVVFEAEKQAGHRRANIMVWAILQYIQKHYGFQQNRTIYALAVNNSSKNILERCGFCIACHARNRKDKYNLYKLEISTESIEPIQKRMGDYSRMCNFALS